MPSRNSPAMPAMSVVVSRFSAAANSHRLAGKVAVITGGASGIGKVTAAEFVRNGATAELGAGDAAIYTRCDMTDKAQVATAVDLTVARRSRVDVVFNNVGIGGSLAPIPMGALDLADFDRVVAVNARAVAVDVRHAVRVMVPAHHGGSIICTASTAGVVGGVAMAPYSVSKVAVIRLVHTVVGGVMVLARRGGSIICTASTTGVVGSVAMVPYCVSKVAIIGLVRAVAGVLARSGVLLNAISLHYIPTPLVMGAMAEWYPGMSVKERRRVVVRDLNEMDGPVLVAEDVARAALYLASDESKYVNGHNLESSTAGSRWGRGKTGRRRGK